jgi:glycosyltransferase involved in cell wall biosynthesis
LPDFSSAPPDIGVPNVTIVIATYNRAHTLKITLDSLKFQTHTAWQALVIGDCCDPETGALIASLNDNRIRYVNLPTRCGEQAIPNSTGFALADTEYVAFLNHDDVWLHDHLAIGIEALVRAKADFYASLSAFAFNAAPMPEGFAFSEISPTWRTLEATFFTQFFLFEPISSWIVRREAVAPVMPFAPAAMLFRAPLPDWVLRASRAGVRFTNGDKITCVKDNSFEDVSAYPPGTPAYQLSKIAASAVLKQMAEMSTDACRASILENHRAAQALGILGRNVRDMDPNIAPYLTPESYATYLNTGVDAYDSACQSLSLSKGFVLREAVRYRTGVAMPEPPNYDMLLASARQLFAGMTL